jgi:peptidyl-tRNA hydrolase
MITNPLNTNDFNDLLVMYLVVREELNMGVGKIGAQIGHAVQYIMSEYDICKGSLLSDIDSEMKNKALRMSYWLGRDFDGAKYTKIILRADDKEWEKLKEYNPIIVKDAGKTQVAAGSETVMVFYPMYRDERPKLLKRLQLLE